MPRHAVANGCYVCAVNRVGTEGESDWGSPSWRTTAKSSPRPPSAMKPSCTRSWTWTRWKTTAALAFFRDRRIDSYGGITER
ncbi:MAG: hypothetical protein ACLT8E_04820 [Akkermansia sp.]